jgi:hypothetical protein
MDFNKLVKRFSSPWSCCRICKMAACSWVAVRKVVCDFVLFDIVIHGALRRPFQPGKKLIKTPRSLIYMP